MCSKSHIFLNTPEDGVGNNSEHVELCSWPQYVETVWRGLYHFCENVMFITI